MGRWTYLLSGLLYLGVQVASLLHQHFPQPTVCSECRADSDQPAWQCTSDDCTDPGHHHHRHDPHHQPGTCRICTSGEAAIAEGHALVAVVLDVEFHLQAHARTDANPSPAGHLSRAPPAADPFPV